MLRVRARDIRLKRSVQSAALRQYLATDSEPAPAGVDTGSGGSLLSAALVALLSAPARPRRIRDDRLNLEVSGLRKGKRLEARLSTKVIYVTQKHVRNLSGDLRNRCGDRTRHWTETALLAARSVRVACASSSWRNSPSRTPGRYITSMAFSYSLIRRKILWRASSSGSSEDASALGKKIWALNQRFEGSESAIVIHESIGCLRKSTVCSAKRIAPQAAARRSHGRSLRRKSRKSGNHVRSSDFPLERSSAV